MTGPLVALLVDAGQGAGFGHLRRQLVLARALEGLGARVVFGLPDPDAIPWPDARIPSPFRWSPGERAPEADAVVVDSYRADPPSPGGPAVAVMDDLGERPVEADLVINHNAYGDLCDYSAYRARRVLAGPRYAMVGQEFTALRGRPGDAVLISFGATDDGSLAAPLAEAVRARMPAVPIVVALVRSDPAHMERLRGVNATVRVGRPLDETMADARVVAGSAGFTILETLAAGRSPVVCMIAANQRLNIDFARRRGLPAFDAPAPDDMARAIEECYAGGPAAALPEVDGTGADRVAAAVVEAASQARPRRRGLR